MVTKTSTRKFVIRSQSQGVSITLNDSCCITAILRLVITDSIIVTMEFRQRFAETVLRKGTSPVSSFLLSSVSKWTSTSLSQQTRRSIATSPFHSAIRPSAVTTSDAPAAATSDKPHLSSSETTELLSWTKSSLSANSTTRFKSPRAQAENRANSPYADRNKDDHLLQAGNSTTDLLRHVNQDFSLRRGQHAVDNHFKPFALDLSRDSPPLAEKRLPVRLNPTAGRTVSISSGVDVARGFRLLEQTCFKNKVKSDSYGQVFHERSGLKRKRLRRQRWRRKFMEGFKATVFRVKEMKAQGW